MVVGASGSRSALASSPPTLALARKTASSAEKSTAKGINVGATKKSAAKEATGLSKGKQAATTTPAAVSMTKKNSIASASVADNVEGRLRYTPIVQGKATSLPVVFTKDSDYFCVATSSSIKIHSRVTGEVISTLSSLERTETSRIDARSIAHTDTITGLMIHPQNPLQMITSSLDGTIKVWDYLDAVLLKNIDVGFPITHLAAHTSIKDSLYVAVRKPKTGTASGIKPDPYTFTGRTNSIIYSVSYAVTGGRSIGGGVTPRRPRELLRLGKTKEASGLQVSPDGKWLVAIGNRKVQIASTATVKEGFTKFVSDERLVSLAFHPTDPTFATGDSTGKIRLWYCLDAKYIAQSQQAGAEKRAPSTLLHWHSHAVSCLAFTPNGAYLLSGGEEAVLVLWQLSSKSREYVPRLGAPINSIAIADGSDGGEQEFVLGLADGSVVFVGALNLKATRSFARVKIDPSRKLLPAARLATLPSPLAIEPCTGQVVMASGHPSSLQFFDVANDRIVSELEIAPSNRVSRPEDTPLEPTRIEQVVFSPLTVGGEGSGPAEWMATLDSRRGGGHLSGELALKFWRYSLSAGTYVLNTRIDKPHAEGVTSMAFSPLSRSDDPASLLFVTTGLDGKVKTWRIASHAARGGRLEIYWVPRSVFGYRETIPMKATWSPDGSLLAVAQGPFLTLWEPISNSLTMALSCPELKTAKSAEFVGRAGRYMVLASGRTMVLWDLVQGSVKWNKTFDEVVERIVVIGGGAGWAALRSVERLTAEGARNQKSSTIVEVYDPLLSEPISTHHLPAINVRETAAFTARAVTSTMGGGVDISPRFLAVTDSFEVLDIGTLTQADEKVAGPSSSTGNGATAQSLRSVAIKRRTLFDDLFGSTADALLEEHLQTQAHAGGRGGGGQRVNPGKDVFALLDAPPHLLPPVRLLFESFVPMVLPPRRNIPTEGQSKAHEDQSLSGDEDVEVDDEQMLGAAADEARQRETARNGTGASQRTRTVQEEEEEVDFLTALFSQQLSTKGQNAQGAKAGTPGAGVRQGRRSVGTPVKSGGGAAIVAVAASASPAVSAGTPKGSNGRKADGQTPGSVSTSSRKPSAKERAAAAATSPGGSVDVSASSPTLTPSRSVSGSAAKKRKSAN